MLPIPSRGISPPGDPEVCTVPQPARGYAYRRITLFTESIKPEAFVASEAARVGARAGARHKLKRVDAAEAGLHLGGEVVLGRRGLRGTSGRARGLPRDGGGVRGSGGLAAGRGGGGGDAAGGHGEVQLNFAATLLLLQAKDISRLIFRFFRSKLLRLIGRFLAIRLSQYASLGGSCLGRLSLVRRSRPLGCVRLLREKIKPEWSRQSAP